MAVYTETRNRLFVVQGCATVGCLTRMVVTGGFVAGLSFTVFQMAVAWLFNGSPFMPMRYMTGITGSEAIEPWFPLTVALPIGFTLLMMQSVLLAAAFVLILHYIPWPVHTRARMIAAASIFGVLAWLTGVYVIAPLFGWHWFPERINPLLQGFLAHGIFYGTVLGVYLSRWRADLAT